MLKLCENLNLRKDTDRRLTTNNRLAWCAQKGLAAAAGVGPIVGPGNMSLTGGSTTGSGGGGGGGSSGSSGGGSAGGGAGGGTGSYHSPWQWTTITATGE
uniref:Uncharacterized protein n=1 Tax=Anopheles albimanus TaxID=7167 RepID=A0A182FUQ5_ANOAL